MSVRVAGLVFYPVKSCRGIEREALELDASGARDDRRWMVVDEKGRFLTQRELPALARVKVSLGPRRLTLETQDGRCRVPLDAPGPRVDIEIWKRRGPAVDMGEEAAALLSRQLGRPARLVRAGEGPFFDTAPLLVISKASLALLNEKLDVPLPMDRFRPNVVLDGGTAHQEDGWSRLRLGSVLLERVEACTRCAITTVDQRTGEAGGPEPLKTLAAYRRGERGVEFGMYYRALGKGSLRVGAEAVPQ